MKRKTMLINYSDCYTVLDIAVNNILESILKKFCVVYIASLVLSIPFLYLYPFFRESNSVEKFLYYMSFVLFLLCLFIIFYDLYLWTVSCRIQSELEPVLGEFNYRFYLVDKKKYVSSCEFDNYYVESHLSLLARFHAKYIKRIDVDSLNVVFY
jgi:magnesium-transporting ATPase (P-type)